MKRISAILLCLAIVLTLSACGIGQAEPVQNDLTNITESSLSKIDMGAAESTEANLVTDSSINQIADNPLQEISDNSDSSNAAIMVSTKLQVHYIDVGQADSILITTNGESMLIDAGNSGDGSMVVNYINNQGISNLKYVVGTHPHEDHIGGLDTVINSVDVKNVLMPKVQTNTQTFEDVLDAIANHNLSITAPKNSDTYQLGEATVTVVSNQTTDDLNNSSLMLRLEFGDTTFLFTGDAEIEAEDSAINSGATLQSDVLKIGHHGSDTSTSNGFLEAVQPRYGVISCGTGNSYGHPAQATLNNLSSAEIELFRTDKQGTIVATSDGATISWNVAPLADPTADPGSIEDPQAEASTVVQPPEPNATPSYENTYIVNVNTGKFHYSDCGSVKQMKESNKRELTSSRNEIISQGYVPCKKCNP